MTRALVLAGHGSHLNARSSEAVRAHARSLAGDGDWDEVLVAFWKKSPPSPAPSTAARPRT